MTPDQEAVTQALCSHPAGQGHVEIVQSGVFSPGDPIRLTVACGPCGRLIAMQVAVDPSPAPALFTCPVCGARSWNPNDARHGYCGRCHDWTGRPAL